MLVSGLRYTTGLGPQRVHTPVSSRDRHRALPEAPFYLLTTGLVNNPGLVVGEKVTECL